MTRTLISYGASGCLLLLFACGSGSSDGGNPSATGSGGSRSTGTGGAGGTSGSGTGGSAGRGGSSTGGAGTGGAGAGSGAGGTGVAGSSGSGGSTAGSGGSAGARDGGSTAGTAGTPGVDASRDVSTDAGTPGADASRDVSADAGMPGADASRDAGTPGTDASGDVVATNFSFFVASLKALQTLSGKTEGFGGNLTFGQANGLAGADEICRQTAEMGMTGAGNKSWRAFLSATQGPGGTAVNARDRIGPGPWYDRNGRLLAASLTDLFAGARPKGDAMLVNDFSNERGEPNHYVGAGGFVPSMTFDNHDTLTGSDTMGVLRATGMADTCNDWTSTTVTGRPWIGHSWPRGGGTSGQQWASDHQVPGCVPGLDVTLGGTGSGSCVGCSGGYGGFFCFALP